MIGESGICLEADVGTKALTGAKLKELMKLMGMKARGESEEDIERSVLARLEVSKCQGLVAVLGCCMQVQGAVAMEEKPEEKDGGGSYDHLKVFGMLVAVFTVAVMKLLELLAANSSSVAEEPSSMTRRPSSTRLDTGSGPDPVRSSSEAGTGSGELGATAKRTTAAPPMAKGMGKTITEPRVSATRNVDWVAVTKGYSKGYSKGYNKGYNKGTGKQATDPGRDLRPWSEPQAGRC